MRSSVNNILLVFTFCFKYKTNWTNTPTSPEFSVDTYAELSEEVSDLCCLPEENVLPDVKGTFTVYLTSRFTNELAGYLMSFRSAEHYAEEFTVECKSENILPDELLQITPTFNYGGVSLSVDEDHICFLVDGLRYDIHGVNIADSFSQQAMTVAQNIIDVHTKSVKAP